MATVARPVGTRSGGGAGRWSAVRTTACGSALRVSAGSCVRSSRPQESRHDPHHRGTPRCLSPPDLPHARPAGWPFRPVLRRPGVLPNIAISRAMVLAHLARWSSRAPVVATNTCADNPGSECLLDCARRVGVRASFPVLSSVHYWASSSPKPVERLVKLVGEFPVLDSAPGAAVSRPMSGAQ